MRHYDIANRNRDRFTATLSITPTSIFDLNASVSTGKDDYGDSGFGLRDNTNDAWSVGFDVVPTEMVNFGVNYGQEKYKANQNSRTANPPSATDVTFNDPNRDWSLNQDDTVKTFSANLDLLKALPKTDIRIGYDISDGNATYVYGVANAAVVFPTTPLAQLAPLKNKLTDGRVDFKYFVRPNVALGVAYAYEDYKVDDFALGPDTLNQLNPVNANTGGSTNSIYSGYLYRNYTAHTGWLRVTYLW